MKKIYLAIILLSCFVTLSYGQTDTTKSKKVYVDLFGQVIRTTDTLTLIGVGDIGNNKFSRTSKYIDFDKNKQIVLVPLDKNGRYSEMLTAVQVGENNQRLLVLSVKGLQPYLMYN